MYRINTCNIGEIYTFMIEHCSKRQEQKTVNLWLKNHFGDTGGKAVFFTLKFHRKRGLNEWATVVKKPGALGSMSEGYAEQLLSNFLNRLDRTRFSKRAVSQGNRLKRVVFKHRGFSGENPHFHGVVFCEGDADDVLSKCEKIWGNLFSNNWIDLNRSQFEVAASIPNTTFYVAHEVTKLGAEDSWMIDYTHTPTECGSAESAERVRDQKNKTHKLREERLRHQQQK